MSGEPVKPSDVPTTNAKIWPALNKAIPTSIGCAINELLLEKKDTLMYIGSEEILQRAQKNGRFSNETLWLFSCSDGWEIVKNRYVQVGWDVDLWQPDAENPQDSYTFVFRNVPKNK